MKKWMSYHHNPVLFLIWSYHHWITNIIRGKSKPRAVKNR